MNKNLLRIILILLVVGFGVVWKVTQTSAPVLVTNFEECVRAGNPVMESYPRQCRHGDQSFTEDIGNELGKADLIRVEYPRPNQVISSPLAVSGQARGNWFFEASFPVILTNEDGTVIAQGIATALDNWMTTEFVPFTSTLTFTVEAGESGTTGTLILRKDNPSGLPEHDDALEIPVTFADAGNEPEPGTVFCTQDAKLCPDGSYVGRTGPKCEFAPCP